MKKMRNMILLITVLLILACGVFPYELTLTKKDTGQAGDQPSATVTAIVFDTNTPVKTSTRTPVPTSTLASSSTPAATRTPIPTKTATVTASLTAIPTRTVYYCPQAAIGTPCP
jgi:hypothetical protein